MPLAAPVVARHLPAPLVQPEPEPVLASVVQQLQQPQEPPVERNEANDDRDAIAPGDAVLLIVENDLDFARFLLDEARAKGFKGLVTARGAGALTLASQYLPAAITLDMYLPDMDGWRVLDRLKQDFATRHIPVCVISTDDSRDRAFARGALAFVEKPIQNKDLLDTVLERLGSYGARQQRSILVGIRDAAVRREFLALIEDEQVHPVVVKTADRFLEALRSNPFDCVVLDEALGRVDVAQACQAMSTPGGLGPVPLVLYRGNAGGRTEWCSDGRVAVHEAHEVAQLFDLALRSMHLDVSQLAPERRAVLENFSVSDRPLDGKRVLIVDDDMRNIFALATVLEEHGMEIVWADNGREAINRVANDPAIDVVLMDIMMPELDGMATMQEIRKLPQGRSLPMIAVTAKAMKGDREKCIEAGAWDYLSKPVHTQDLLAVLRAWLYA